MNPSESTLDLVRRALAAATDDSLAKAYTFQQPGSATTGLQSYDLEAPAKNLYPVMTPWRNRIPRLGAHGSIQANWRAVTGVDTTQVFAGVAEGRRGQLINISTKDYYAAYRTIGQESSVSFEAELTAEGFDDLRSRAVQSLLQSLMVAEEKLIIGGNTSLSLGTTTTPTVTTATTGGAIAATTAVSVICVALTYQAMSAAYAGAAPAISLLSTGLTPVITVTPTDGAGTFTTGGGVARKSANASVTTGSGSTNSVTATIAPIQGAYGYAWYWGAAGSETLGAITTVSQVVITTAAGAAAQTAASLPSADNSTNLLSFDGMLTIGGNSNFGAQWMTPSTIGAGLTGDGSMGIVEFDAMLELFWNQLRISPTRIVVSAQEMLNIRKKIMGSGGSSSAVRFTFDIQNGQVVGGNKPRGYLNPFVMADGPAEIPIELHPNLPPGTIVFDTDVIPYPQNNITDTKVIRTRRDYYQLEWPLRTRSYEYGVYSDQVLQHYFPPSLGILTNVANL